jgi:hypothetical protein
VAGCAQSESLPAQFRIGDRIELHDHLSDGCRVGSRLFRTDEKALSHMFAAGASRACGLAPGEMRLLLQVSERGPERFFRVIAVLVG